MLKVLMYSVFSGLLFGFGLATSGMANPAKVIGFLDVLGDWDPSLALVMIGALVVTIPGFQHFKNVGHCAIGAPIRLPSNNVVDRPLILGAVLFGLGWGIAGLCPGPALIGLVTLQLESFLYVLSMLIGMLVYHLVYVVQPINRAV